jgi:hypothetical protein
MKNIDKIAWWDKNERVNADKDLKLGDTVTDADKNIGVVVKIVPASEDFHGVIYVWQRDRFNYGDDNCEHYSADSWKRHLRIVD